LLLLPLLLLLLPLLLLLLPLLLLLLLLPLLLLPLLLLLLLLLSSLPCCTSRMRLNNDAEETVIFWPAQKCSSMKNNLKLLVVDVDMAWKA